MAIQRRYQQFLFNFFTSVTILIIGAYLIFILTPQFPQSLPQPTPLDEGGMEQIGFETPEEYFARQKRTLSIDFFIPRSEEPVLIESIREQATKGMVLENLTPVWTDTREQILVTRLYKGETVTILQLLSWSLGDRGFSRYAQIIDRFGNHGFMDIGKIALLGNRFSQVQLGVIDTLSITAQYNLPQDQHTIIGSPKSVPVIIFNGNAYILNPDRLIDGTGGTDWKLTLQLESSGYWREAELGLSLTSRVHTSGSEPNDITFLYWAIIGFSPRGPILRFSHQELLHGSQVKTTIGSWSPLGTKFISAYGPTLEISTEHQNNELDHQLLAVYQALEGTEMGIYKPRAKEIWKINGSQPVPLLQNNVALRRSPSIQGQLITRLPRGSLLQVHEIALPRGSVARQEGYWVLVSNDEEPEVQGWLWGGYLAQTQE